MGFLDYIEHKHNHISKFYFIKSCQNRLANKLYKGFNSMKILIKESKGKKKRSI